MKELSRNGWLVLAGAAGLIAVTVGWGDAGSVLFGMPILNLILCFLFTIIACYAVYRAGPD